MPKATQKTGEEIEEGPEGVINLEEARAHVEALDEAMEMIQKSINENNTESIT